MEEKHGKTLSESAKISEKLIKVSEIVLENEKDLFKCMELRRLALEFSPKKQQNS